MKKYLAFITFLILSGLNNLPAQDYLQAFQEGEELYQSEDYYEAYLRFKAALVLSENAGNTQYVQQSRDRLNQSALGIQQQQQRTDSLLKATRKLTDALYFYEGRLALAYSNGKFGFMSKKGEPVIDYLYETVSHFDEATGYARVTRNGTSYWLAPDGREYPGDQDINRLPKIKKGHELMAEKEGLGRKTLDLTAYETKSDQDYHQVLREGIRLYNEGQYYDAYLRFNAVEVLAENAEDGRAAQMGKQLKDASIDEIRRLFTRAKEALMEANNIRDVFYFYDDKYALAFKDEQFYFIDRHGNEYSRLGRWEKAGQFDRKGWAKTEKDGLNYLIDTTGRTYRVAYTLDDLKEDLSALDLRGVWLERFPTEIFNHSQLEVLLLDGPWHKNNPFKSIPTAIHKLKKLQVISLKSGSLETLPAEIGQLTNLSELDLRNNRLSGLPVQIGQLINLKSLDLSSNRLINLFTEIGQLTNLKSLNLSSNGLNGLPAEINQLISLKSLNLNYNHLNELPAETNQLINLIELSLSSNQLRELPAEISRLTNLKSLYLNDNRLNELPAEINRLTNLRSLHLRNNQLRELPAEISQLINLKSLDLSSNQLRELPAEISRLTNLKSLYLNDNQLSELPAEISRLTNLSELSLSSNQLRELPAEIGRLANLKFLNLRENNDLNISSVFALLKQSSKSIYIVTNQPGRNLDEFLLLLEIDTLNSIPPQIGQLTNLSELDLTGSQLSKLPPEIRAMKSLKKIDLRGNPFSETYIRQLQADMPWCYILWEPLAPKLFFAQKYPEAFAAQQEAAAADPTNYKLHFDLSRYALYVRKLQIAVEAAKKTLELNPNAQSVETNLALGYLLAGQWAEAEKIYRKWKGKTFPNDDSGWSCNEIFLKDISDLEKAGITHSNFEKVRRLMKE